MAECTASINPAAKATGPVDKEKGQVGAETLENIISLEGCEVPQNWSALSRWSYTAVVVWIAGIVGFSSSVQTPAIPAIAQDFGVSNLLSTLGATTYLVGSALGPLLLAPLSELWGRNPLYYGSFLLFTLSNLGIALSPNIAALLVFRFLAGLFGLPAVANSGGSITDLWPPSHRSVPFALFTAASFCGPVLAPIIAGFLTQHAGWRWNFWLVFIISAVLYVIVVFLLPETYPPQLLKRKRAKHGRLVRYESQLTQLRKSLIRPWEMLFTEPILFALSLYMAFIYGVLYLDFTAYPVVFQKTRHWSLGISGLSFTGIGVGMFVATVLSPYVNIIHGHYVKKLGAVPEARLPHLNYVVWLLPVSLFWFGWSADPPVHWSSSVVAGAPFGFALVLLFLAINAYLTDCYDRYGASALAANTMLRCLFGAGFALFATDMYAGLGTAWATSVLGFVALAMGVLPLVFCRYGARLRRASKFHQSVLGEVANSAG